MPLDFQETRDLTHLITLTPLHQSLVFVVCRRCEERSDEAIHTVSVEGFWIASLRSQ